MAEDFISAPYARFSRNILELFEFVNVMIIQRTQLNSLTQKTVETFNMFPEALRRQIVPDHAYLPLKELVEKGIGVADIVRLYIPLVVELSFCRSVDYYLLYIAELLALIFHTKPQALKSKEQITLETVLEHSSFEELLETITEKKVLELSFMGVLALTDYLKKRLSFELFDGEDDLQKAIRIVEDRNLFIHNRGVVNKVYLNRLPQTALKLGDKLPVTPDNMFHDVSFLNEMVKATDSRAAGAFGIPRADTMPKSKIDEGIMKLPI